VNAKDCIKNAQECIEQASCGKSDQAKAELLRVAMEWLQLAEEIDGLPEEIHRDAVILSRPTKAAKSS